MLRSLYGRDSMAPKGVRLEHPVEIAQNARQIYLQSGMSHAMPPANITYMTDEERHQLRQWFRSL